MTAILPPWIVLDSLLHDWLLEDIGRGDRTTSALFPAASIQGTAKWIVKEAGVIAGLPIADRTFKLLDSSLSFIPQVPEGKLCEKGEVIAEISGNFEALLTGERVALNLAMRLSGIATLTQKYVDKIADLPVQLVAAVGILLTMLGVRDLMGMDRFTLVAKVHRNSYRRLYGEFRTTVIQPQN